MKLNQVGRLVKNAWLVVGITVLLFCLLEGAFSLAFLIRMQFRSTALSAVGADTYADSSWVKSYYEEYHRAGVAEWQPYVYWRRRPFHGDHINIDADGIRLTIVPEPRSQESAISLKIFMFGGSTMWGTGARDAFTIPSILAKELLHKGIVPEIINFGESGYVSTQEVIALLLQLQKGHIPTLVIFYDGVNDTYSAYQQHVAGLPMNEFNRVKEFKLLYPASFKQRLGLILQVEAQRLSTTRFLKGLLRKAGVWHDAGPLLRDNPASDDEGLVRGVLKTYTRNIELVQALSKHYHFQYLFYWQPTLFQKVHLTQYERFQRSWAPGEERFFQKTYELIQQNRITENSGDHFHDLSLIFSDMREPVYIDRFHLGESGNEIIAKKMANDILQLIPPNRSCGTGRCT